MGGCRMSNDALEKKKVCVLLSSYNGEKYIKRQLDSILNQSYHNISILVRDDGSSDDTLKILEEYSKSGYISYYLGENLKPARSFIDLLLNAPKADYYAFSDQDDVWHNDKIQQAISKIDRYGSDIPLLYGSNANVVDENGTFIKLQHDRNPIKQMTVMGAIIRSVLLGCTMVMNRKMVDLLRKDTCGMKIADIQMHDVWVLIFALINGKFIYDPKPHIDYYRHGSNFSAGGISDSKYSIEVYKKKIKNFFSHRVQGAFRSDTAKCVLEAYGDRVSPELVDRLYLLRDYPNSIIARIRLMFRRDVYRYINEVIFIYWFRIWSRRL